jgi:hypothetical protein
VTKGNYLNWPVPNPDKPQPKRNWLVREIPNSKSQIPNNGVSFGQILNAFGEEQPGSCGALQVRTQDTFSSYKLDDLADFRRFHGMSSPCFKMLVFIYNYRHIVTVLKSKCQPRWENANL